MFTLLYISSLSFSLLACPFLIASVCPVSLNLPFGLYVLSVFVVFSSHITVSIACFFSPFILVQNQFSASFFFLVRFRLKIQLLVPLYVLSPFATFSSRISVSCTISSSLISFTLASYKINLPSLSLVPA